MKGAIPHFRARRSGLIVNVASIAAIRTSYCWPLYSASAFSLRALSKSIAAELESFNVGVMFVQPGFVQTHAGSVADESENESSERRKKVKLDDEAHVVKGAIEKDGKDLERATRTIVSIVAESLQSRGWNGSLKLPVGEDAFISVEMKNETSLWDSEYNSEDSSQHAKADAP